MRASLRLLRLAVFTLLLAAASGCATLHSWAQVNSGGSPHFGTSVSVPFGGDGKK